MVKHDILVRGVDMVPVRMGGIEQSAPVILQMNDDDFPARFLEVLAAPRDPPPSSVTLAEGTLYQPVQRMLNVAMVKLSCDTIGSPRLDPRRVLSAGLVVRRVVRQGNGKPHDPKILAAWMRSPSGQFSWKRLHGEKEAELDPDPTQRRQVPSGQAALDLQLAALANGSAFTESTTPAFAAPPATCATLSETIFYAVVPTASSEVSGGPEPPTPQIEKPILIKTLPPLLLASSSPPAAPAGGKLVDYRWMSDDYLNSSPSMSQDDILNFQGFATALRMLHNVFGAFDGTPQGNRVVEILNRRQVRFTSTPGPDQAMGAFYQKAKSVLLGYNPYPSHSGKPPTLPMPDVWEPLTAGDQSDLVDAMLDALTPRLQTFLAPQGRYQDATREYRLRFFFRVKSEHPQCPPELVWSDNSDVFQIAAWYDGGRPHPPIPLPDPTPAFLASAKPNCAFQVPGSLMSAMQGTTLSGLMKGAGGGSGLSLNWICGFNIPLITICAFFVLNIFLILLNIVFFWLPFIKICIPFPAPSPSQPDPD